MSDEGRRYALRVTEAAEQEVARIRAALVARAGKAAADAWEDGLFEKISHLSSSPHYALAPENDLFTFEVRAFPYRRPGSSVAYRVLYHVQEDSPDGPRVWVLHVRHGAAGPMQAFEARDIEADLEE